MKKITNPILSDIRQQFILGGKFDTPVSGPIKIAGLVLAIIIWWAISEFSKIPNSILPSPREVWLALAQLFTSGNVEQDILFSLKINFLGYVKAVFYSLLLGYIIGQYGIVRNLTTTIMDALRYVPLSAVLGLFIAWFGIGVTMKVNFLAFGIFVYLLAAVVQSIDGVLQIHKDTAWTLGASRLQVFRYVVLPSSLSRMFPLIGIILAVSWTYTIMAEMINSEYGLGVKIFKAGRQAHIDYVFAYLVIIILIGLFQDLFVKALDRILFPSKFALTEKK